MWEARSRRYPPPAALVGQTRRPDRDHAGTTSSLLDRIVTAVTASYTEEHVGKRVVDQRGREIGTVRDVRGGDLYVEVGPDADPGTLSELNWDGTVNQREHRLLDRHISTVSEATVRLSV